MSQLLTKKLSAVRRKRAMVTAFTGATMAVGAVAVLVGLTLVVDWWIELPRAARAAALAVELAILTYFVIWHIVRPIVYGPDDEDLALQVERETPDFRSRLISVIQLLRPAAAAEGMSVAMVGALVRETEAMAGPMDFTRVIKVDRLASLGTVVAIILVGSGVALAATAPASVALLQRAVLMNVSVPRKTIVIDLTRDMYIPRGESVTISAKATGLIIPNSGSVQLKLNSGAVQSFDMARNEGTKDQYSCTIENVQEDFNYTVHLNDGHGETYKVIAAIRPAVSAVDCQQQFPKYTGLGLLKRQVGDLTLLDGSRLLVNITANKPVKFTSTNVKERNYIHLHGSELEFPLTVDPGNPTLLMVKDAGDLGMPLPKGTTGFSVHLIDDQGLTSKNPAIYPITLVADQAPRITVNSPKRNDELVTTAATVLVGFDASDDYGVKSVQLRYRLLDPEGSPIGSAGDGLMGSYYKGADFKTRVAERVDPTIDFDWSFRNQPGADIPKYSLGVRWTGQLQPPVSGDFTFTVVSPAKTQVWIDDKALFDSNGETKPVTLKAFQRYDIRIEYVAKTNAVPVHFQWQGPGIGKTAVPKEYLFSTPVADKMTFVASGGVPEKIIQMQLATDKSVRGYYEWKISQFSAGLPLGSVIQWRLQVTDTNDVTGPGIAYSEPMRQLRLVSEADKRKELMDRMTEQIADIDKINDAQRENSQRTAKMVTGTLIDPSLDVPTNQKSPQK